MSAKIVKVEPEYVDVVKGILTTTKKEFIYGKESINHEIRELAIYVNKVEESQYGFKSYIYIDGIIWFTRIIRKKDKIEPERIPIVTTSIIETIYYYRIPIGGSLEHVIAIFPAGKSYLFIDSISRYLSKEMENPVVPFCEIRLNITKDNEDKLRGLFDNIVRVNTKDLDSDKITTLGMGGPAIAETEEWKKAFHDYEGKASSVAFRYKGYWIMVSEKGVIFSLSRDIEKVKELIVYEVLEKLYRAGLIVVKPIKRYQAF